ncbi:ABC transporter ATP-binding protein [Mesorhizobium sp. YM1C-6-2]|uniref:ABC transporter ATP-binding protein n=1 Tax=Mesorhizobium sp. YM1C-6-2 TaxID=1827501 RepID=UPI000EF1984F|nr:ABC transporter ATP-binding protein [Mesorhizobium sp. YM1C-6-2]RLP24067.1 ABC transporter ATP-binding protein [Mesorhizobium sp. YM1C-6-2]
MLEVSDLGVRYGAIRAVHDVSLQAGKGELIAILGANGAGKSSTLKCIAGALKASAGTIRLDGQDVTSAKPEQMVRLGVAMVPETRDVFPDLTVSENLTLGSYIHRRNRADVESTRERMLGLFPRLRERARQAAGTLSGGEQQMLVIARALMSRPKLLLLDEPSLGLAPVVVDTIFEMIAELKRSGLTIVLVEQNAAKALSVADRAYVMRLGRIAAKGPAAEIAANTDLGALYLGG